MRPGGRDQLKRPYGRCRRPQGCTNGHAATRCHRHQPSASQTVGPNGRVLGAARLSLRTQSEGPQSMKTDIDVHVEIRIRALRWAHRGPRVGGGKGEAAPRLPKATQGVPKRSQRAFKGSPRGSKGAPRGPPGGPKSPQGTPKGPQKDFQGEV